MLLRAAALLKARSSQSFRLWLVGDGDERPMLEALRSELGLDDEVTLLGSTSTVSEFLAAADAFVMSSKTEGLPMALIEAMAHRVPCIATRVGGIPALFAHGTGLLAEPQSPDSLATRMQECMANPGLRTRIIAAAFDQVRREFDLERVADRYLELLELPRSWNNAASGP